jgi:hypothetical protein
MARARQNLMRVGSKCDIRKLVDTAAAATFPTFPGPCFIRQDQFSWCGILALGELRESACGKLGGVPRTGESGLGPRILPMI